MYRKENLDQSRELLHFFSFLSIQQDSKYSSNFSNIYLTGLKFVCLGKFSNHLLSRNDFQQLYVHKVCRYLHFNLQCAQHFDSGVELLNTHNFHKDCTMEPFIFWSCIWFFLKNYLQIGSAKLPWKVMVNLMVKVKG